MPTPSPLGAIEDRAAAAATAASEALVALHNRTVDALHGYAIMVEKAEPSFRATAEQFRALHARHADALARMLSEMGVEADPGGTFMATVNRTMVTVRAFFDAIDEDVMQQIRSGEDWVLAAFDDAIVAVSSKLVDLVPTTAALRDMRDELATLLSANGRANAARLG